MSERFAGWYMKHQKAGRILSLIPGLAEDRAFIQVLTDDEAYNIVYPRAEYRNGEQIEIAGNCFSCHGVELDIDQDGLKLKGHIAYQGLTPLKSDIMGPFRFFPMQCRHSVISMRHNLMGSLLLNGETFDFDYGLGYMEGDSGSSFPESYTWVQCNAFAGESSVMAAVARIPWAGFKFWGCIAALYDQGREYRLATYYGARIITNRRGRIELRQGKHRLEIDIDAAPGQGLAAPDKGRMRRLIHETAAAPARFRLSAGGRTLFAAASQDASYEFVAPGE